MKLPLASLVTGALFGVGLVFSDLVNPGRVQAFLDVAGEWDPSLAFVIGGAVIPMAIAYFISRRMGSPILDKSFFIPENRVLDRQLILGAALFGIGWGLVGFCPGPALAGLVMGLWQPWLFTGAMLAGMVIHRIATTPAKS